MKRKPTTNPQINGVPMSFVRLGSNFETPLRMVVPDKDGNMLRKYTRAKTGAIERVKESK